MKSTMKEPEIFMKIAMRGPNIPNEISIESAKH
jgi:hypothetical protein